MEFKKSSVLMLVFAVVVNVFNVIYAAVYNPPERIMVTRPTFEGNTERTLRYHPDGTDFVIKNGKEFFNRPLYGGNTAFRVDAGDKPEFSLYLPGHGGNMRFGIRTAEGCKWLHDAETVISRYRPGSMIYEVRDPLLKGGILTLSVMGLYEADGFIVQVKLRGSPTSVEWITTFGGASGKRGKRSGDIGCESQPVSEFFKLTPQNCQHNSFTIDKNHWYLTSKIANFKGVFSEGTQLTVGNSENWNNLEELLASSGDEIQYPVITATMKLTKEKVAYTALKCVGGDENVFTADELPTLFDSTQRQRQQLAQQITIRTPDPYIDAAAAALCIAADAIWDEKQGSVMHGAVAWRSKYLGWRGPYANDVLGWHDRAKRHLTYWATQQDTSPVPEAILPADPTANLARNEPSLHSNGALSHKHYDMNLVYMDALFRHILWTGDLELTRTLWPVIERHMAWERRLFRRPFGQDKLPLYEAYAAIWASDDLQYHGGGVTHASAYNYYHNQIVARLARKLGKDPSPYEKEADLILRGMQKYLWLEDRGWYAEFKDLMGLQKTHPSAALWTFYHTLDSEAADPVQAWQMSRYADTQIAHIPVFGGDIPKGRYFTLPTTNWMPYTWSTNNVVMAEVAHTALAYWQAQRPEKAFSLFKGGILDSMYMGKCPGNAGMTTYFDMARGEAQRDFGDAVGTCSRALIEGLYGIETDMLAGVLNMSPGFPADWEFTTLEHPNLKFSYRRNGQTENYLIEPTFSKPLSLRLQVRARTTQVKAVTVNGKSTDWTTVKEAVGNPAIYINSQPVHTYNVTITWQGPEPADVQSDPIVAKEGVFKADFVGADIIDIVNPQGALDEIKVRPSSLSGEVIGNLGHHTIFARLQQDQMTWLHPVDFEIRNPFEIISKQQQQEDSIEFYIQNNTSRNIDTIAEIKMGNQSSEIQLKIPAFALSRIITLAEKEFPLLPGTNHIHVDLGNDGEFDGSVTNWHLTAKEIADNAEPVKLDLVYNDNVTRIFKNEYLSPRSPYCSLAIPKQGIGSWCNFARTFEVNDSGLRTAAGKNAGVFKLPQGIPFKIPVETKEKNTLFTSQWDNYPESVTIKIDGKARHLYLLMAGSTNSMQSRFDNGEVVVAYRDGSSERLALQNPTTWWPIDQDYFIDDYGFKRPEPIPPRVDLKTGNVRILDLEQFNEKDGTVPGGVATVLDIPLDSTKELASLKVHTLANEVVIGLMSATLIR